MTANVGLTLKHLSSSILTGRSGYQVMARLFEKMRHYKHQNLQHEIKTNKRCKEYAL